MTNKNNRDISADYQDIQIRTLTKWMNIQLEEGFVESIDTDLKDGTILLRLLSVVSNNPTLQPEKGHMKIHAISNVSKALNFLKEEYRGDDNLPVIASEDIFQNILKDKKDGLAEVKIRLLHWIRVELKDYITSEMISPVQDFAKSWKNGLLFCLLIHKIEPDWIPNLTQLLQRIDKKETWHELLNLAFDVAEKELGIPKYLETKDLLDVEYPHEPSIMLYISEFYNRIQLESSEEDEEHRMKRLQDIQIIIQQQPTTPEPKLNDDIYINNGDDITQQLDPLAINVFDYISHDLVAELNNTDIQKLAPLNIQLLSLRFQWEQSFVQAVEWISNTHLELSQFISIARWSGKEDLYTEDVIENIIQSLVALEGKLSDFDRGLYSNILDYYQQMDSMCTLPEHMESRQAGFESAFEDLMKQSEFSRKIVEQLLSVINIVEKFQQSRVLGEELRDELSSDVIQMDTNGQDVYMDKVYSFKQDSARLIQSAATCIPYPPPPDMKTAMGTDDLYHSNEMTKEAIASTVNAYSMSLALIAEGLDQLLNTRDQTISFQQRVTETQDFIKSIQSWFNEKIASLTKTALNPILFSQSLHQSLSSSSASSFNSSSDEPSLINEEELHRLEKERDQTLSHLAQLENEDMIKLEEVVAELEQDWTESLENLKRTHQVLTDLLSQRGLELDALKRRVEWESQWTKYHSQMVTLAKKMCDFNVKRARYDPSKENPDKPSYQGDHELVQSFQWIQDRLGEIGDRPWSLLLDSYQDMVTAYLTVLQTEDESVLPEFISHKQSDLKLKHEDLKQLLTYTSDLMAQRATITEFLMRAQDSFHEGEKIKEQLTKRLRRMKEDDNSLLLEERIDKFRKEIKTIWTECGEHMPYPVYSGNWLRQQSSEAAATYRAHVRAQVKSLLEKKVQDLESLEKSLDQVLATYREADRMKHLVAQYEREADQLRQWIDEQIEALKMQHIEVSAESILVDGNLKELEKSRQGLWTQVEAFEQEKVKSLHDHIVQLMEASMKKSQTVDVTTAARHLGEVMEHLAQLKQGLSDQAVTLEAAGMRTAWENNLSLGIRRLEEMSEQLREFTTKKNQVLSREDVCEEDVQILERELAKLMSLKTKFEKTLLPNIQMSYDTFTEYFPRLPRPMAVPDHLEVRMESLGRSCSRFQETVTARSRELGLIKQKVLWESTVRKALDYLAEKEVEIDRFIDQKARWNTTTTAEVTPVTNDNDEEQLRTEWYAFYSQFETYQEQVLSSIQLQFENLTRDTTDYDHRVIPQAKKINDLETARGRMKHILSFSNDVVSQRCLVSAFILRTAQLEQSAELIREEFIASSNQQEKDVIHLFENHSDRLQKFKASIEDVRHQLAASIPYPVRSSQYISADIKMSDEAINAAIHETINTRNVRLSELWSSLEQLLATRERISRRRLTIHTFKKQATHTGAWIDDRHNLLITYANAEGTETLEKALSDIMSIHQAMKASETSFVLLTSAYEACKFAFEDKSLDQVQSQDDYTQMVRELTEEVHPTYDRLSQEWAQLFSSVEEAHHQKYYALIHHKICSWLKSAKELLESTFTDNVNEESITMWQAQITQLETSGSQYKIDLETNKEQALTEIYRQGLETINKINVQLNHQQKTLELRQMTNKYLADLQLFQNKVQDYIGIYKSIESQYRLVTLESASARENQHQSLVSEYKDSINKVECLKDSYKDVGLQLKAIQSEKNEYTNQTQATMELAWSELLSFESVVASLVSRTASWVQYFNSLTTVEQDLKGIQSRIQHVSEFDELVQMEGQMAVIDATLLQDLTVSSQELLNDHDNLLIFEDLRAKVAQELVKLKLDASTKIKDKNKCKLINHIQQTVDQLADFCCKQTEVLKDHTKQNIWSGSYPDTIECLIKKCDEIFKASVVVTEESQMQLDDLRAIQCKELDLVYQISDTDSLLKPLVYSLGQLREASISEERYMAVLKQVLTFKESEKQLTADMAYIVETASKIGDNEMALADIERHIEFLDEQSIEFVTAMRAFNLEEALITKDQEPGIRKYIETCKERVLDNINKAKEIGKEARLAYEKMIERQRIVSKLKEIIQFVCDVTFKLQDLQSNKKDMLFAELDTLCQHYDAVLPSKEVELQELMLAFFTGPEEIQTCEEISKLHQEMGKAIHHLDKLIASRKKETFDKQDNSQINKLMETFEEEINLLTAAIENASPKNVNTANDKNVKSSLQSLLRSLIDSYKRHQPNIMRTLEQVRQESKKQFTANQGRTDAWLAYGTKKASNIRASAASRERELQDSINQLNSNFFNKLAASKPRRVLPPAPSPATHKRSAEVSATKPNTGSPATPSPIYKRVTTVDSNQRKTANSSLVPNNDKPAYVPDPKNALDVELSNIANIGLVM
ncbi:hypothetical protein G6F56_002382 [Rhizopus delemar]|nr:hypothetical protein G6F56_002382 [Rhizopus delemar]